MLCSQFFSCQTIDPIEREAIKEISDAIRLWTRRDNVNTRADAEIKEISPGTFAISTLEVDKFVIQNESIWRQSIQTLATFSKKYRTNGYADDSFFIACIMYSAITQAKKDLNQDAIGYYEEGLYTPWTFHLEDETKKILQKSPSLKYFLQLFRRNDNNDIKYFLRRMILTEYVKLEDIEGARRKLGEFERKGCPPEEFQDLQKYVETYKQMSKTWISNDVEKEK